MLCPKFFTGQTVKLKSGGLVMTVVGLLAFDMNPNTYLCQWFAGKVYRRATFPEENLKLAAPEDTQKRITKTLRRRL